MSEFMIVMMVVMLVAMFGAGRKGGMSGHGEAANETPEQVGRITSDQAETKSLEVKP